MRYSPAPSTRAASSRSFGDAEHELAHQEHAEGAGNGRQDQAGMGVREVEIGDEHEQRDERHDAGDHQRRQHDGEEHPLAGELELGQGVAEHRAEQQVPCRHGEGDDGRVEEVPGEVEAVEQVAVVLQRWLLGDPPARRLAQLTRRLERAEDHPHERRHHQHEPGEQGDVQADGSRAAPGAHGDRRSVCSVVVVMRSPQVFGRRTRNWIKASRAVARKMM